MSGKTRSLFLSLTIVAVILFSAFGTTSAYADGGTTADPPPTETASDSKEADAGATEAANVDVTSAPETPAKATEESAPTEAATPQPTDEAAPVVEETVPAADATILDAVPENTTVTVVDANGQELPLATEAAADAIATSDPMWCPAGVAPGTAGLCTPSFSSFTALLNELSTNSGAYSGAGTIYVEQGAYTGGETTVDFNAYNLSNISGANMNLTVMGGWDGTANMNGSAATPSTFTNTSLIIGSPTSMWGGSLTLLNLSFSDTTGTGLTLYSQTNITLVEVDVTNSTNGAGAELNAGGLVSVVNSNFTRNKTAGAIIRAGTGVAVVQSSFSNPATARRQNTGLDIETSGFVSLTDVFANENRLAGADINAGGLVTITRGFFSGTREMIGSGPSTNFLGYGLQVETPAGIDLVDVTASNNFLWGASLATDGNISIARSTFNANTTASPGFIDDTGLFITRAADVALIDVHADNNRLYGAQIGLLHPLTGLPTVTGDVSITGNPNTGGSTFSNNRGVITSGGVTTYNGHGLQVTTQGDITIGNVTANNNMLFGAQLNAGGAVDIANSTFNNNSTGVASNAVGVGLEINTPGDVSLLNVVANNNQTDGVRIQQGVCTSVNAGNFSGNGQNGLNLGSSALNLIVPPVGGNIFPANPALCSLMLLGGGNTTTSAASNAFVSLQTASQQNASIPVTSGANPGSAEVTLNSVLSKTANGGLGHSFFAGKYTYVYSKVGLQIFALSSSKEVAMQEAFRAY